MKPAIPVALALLASLPHSSAADGYVAFELFFTAETGFQPLPCTCNKAPLGGWSQRAALLDSVRATPEGAGIRLVVDAGGWLAGGPSPTAAALAADAMSRLSYDVINAGPTELAFVGEAALGAAALPLVSGDPRRPAWIPSHRVITRSGARIAVIGAARLEPGAPVPVEQVSRALEEIDAAVDAVIVLLAGGLGPVNTIAASGARVDVVLYGEGARTPKPVVRGALVAAAPGTKGRRVGRLLVSVAPDREPESTTLELLPVRRSLTGPVELLRIAYRAADANGALESHVEKTFTFE